MKGMRMKEMKTNINEGNHGSFIYFFCCLKSHTLVMARSTSCCKPANRLTPNPVEMPMIHNR